MIEGSVAIPDFGSAEQTPWYRDRAQIKGIILGEDITGIGANAFAGLTGTTRVDFNQATTPAIDENAFAGSNIVCRYYTTEGTWPAATVTSGYGAASIKGRVQELQEPDLCELSRGHHGTGGSFHRMQCQNLEREITKRRTDGGRDKKILIFSLIYEIFIARMKN